MDNPICVIDAKTLVDRIQDVKRWIYNGQVHLIVPTSTFEQVEQLYQKSREVKPTPQEPSRPKSSGKPIRKEYPTFDLNPDVARTFLTRLKSWKEEDAVSEQRDFLREKENHDAVEFQQTNEQYTPWKDIEIEEEKPGPIMDRPLTWAEALRRKQNLANGISDSSETPGGPVKPKLVARAPGSNSSPWKLKKNTPKISAKDVSGSLRPLMSCVLWRLHESIHRNDVNQLFLYSDQFDIRSVAEKLNIVVRSTPELKTLIASKADKSDAAAFGDLEREFGVQQHDEKAPSTGSTEEEKSGGEQVVDVLKPIEITNDSMPGEDSGKANGSHLTDKDNHVASENDNQETAPRRLGKAKSSPVIDGADGKPLVENKTDPPTVNLVESKIPEVSAWSKPLADLVRKTNDDTRKRLEDAHREDGNEPSEISRTSSRSALGREGQKLTKCPPKAVSPSISPQQEEAAEPTQSEPAPEIIDHATPPSNASQTPSSQAPQEPEDSDKEEIVFKPNPKRYSAQKKPVQQNSRPSTPKSQPPQNSDELSPQVSTLKPQPKPKPTSHSRHPMVVGHGHPQPKGSPTVIDPDAFGRNFVVNTNPSPRTLNNHRGHYYPRPHSSHGQPPPIPRSPRRQDPRLSPPRRYQENAQGASSASEPKDEPASRTSPRRKSGAIDTEQAVPRDAESQVLAPGVKSSLPAPRPFEIIEFVPRPSSVNVRLANPGPTPSMNGSRDYQSADFGARSQISQAIPEVMVPGPRVFETSEFAPRSAMITPLYKPRAPEPESIEPRASMPDVEYILKSGTTRASARGRGRLWTPS